MAESSGRLGKGSGSGPGKGAVSADQVRSAEGAGGPAGPEKARAAGPRPASPRPASRPPAGAGPGAAEAAPGAEGRLEGESHAPGVLGGAGSGLCQA